MDRNTTRLKEKLDRLEQDQKVNRLSLRAALALAARAGVDFAQDGARDRCGEILPPPSDATPLGPLPAAGALPRETRDTIPPPGQAPKARQWSAQAIGVHLGEVAFGLGQSKEQAEENALEDFREQYGIAALAVTARLA